MRSDITLQSAILFGAKQHDPAIDADQSPASRPSSGIHWRSGVFQRGVEGIFQGNEGDLLGPLVLHPIVGSVNARFEDRLVEMKGFGQNQNIRSQEHVDRSNLCGNYHHL